jgi:hypothetical protein
VLTRWIGDPQLAIDSVEPAGVNQLFDGVLRVSRFSCKFLSSRQEVLDMVVREFRLLIRVPDTRI